MIDIQRKRRILNSIWMCLKLKVIKTDLVYNLIQLLGWAVDSSQLKSITSF
jgi:hypothetical protein